jgi:hypothetical protein
MGTAAKYISRCRNQREGVFVGNEFLSIPQIAAAAHLAGRDYTAKEIADELGRTERSVRISLGSVGVSLKPKPSGFRHVTITLSPVQVEGVRMVAQRENMLGREGHIAVLEKACRRLATEPDLLASLMEKSQTPAFVSAETFDLLRPEAERRGVTPGALAAMIVDVVARDGIVGAVLD